MNTNTPIPHSALNDWLTEAAHHLGLDDVFSADEALLTHVLQLAADVAHGVARPSAPLTTFLLGLHAGRTGVNAEATHAAADQLTALVGPFVAARDGAAPSPLPMPPAPDPEPQESECDCERDGSGPRDGACRRG